MIPPVTTQPQTTRPVAADVTQRGQGQQANAGFGPPQGLVKSEAPNAVSAARRAVVVERLSERNVAARADPPPSKQDPVGPTPAFRETILQRQARLAFDMPETADDAGRSAALEGAGAAVVTPDLPALPSEIESETAQIDAQGRETNERLQASGVASGSSGAETPPEVRTATTGFAAAAVQFAPARPPSVDQTV